MVPWSFMPMCCRIMALTLLLSRLQIDLEPEGKVFVVIDLTGSSSEGRKSPSCSYSSSSSYKPAASSFSLRNFLFRLFSAHDLALSTSQQHLGSNAECSAAHPSQWCENKIKKTERKWWRPREPWQPSHHTGYTSVSLSIIRSKRVTFKNNLENLRRQGDEHSAATKLNGRLCVTPALHKPPTLCVCDNTLDLTAD